MADLFSAFYRTTISNSQGGSLGGTPISSLSQIPAAITDAFRRNEGFITDQKAGSNINALADSAALWGTTIPVTWGKRKVAAGVLQVGNVKRVAQIYRYSYGSGRSVSTGYFYTATQVGWEFYYYFDYAVALGYPGDGGVTNKAVRRIWLDGVLSYDSANPKATDVKFSIYPGSATQGPAPILTAQFSDQISYRGLTYMVIENCPIPRTGSPKLPRVDVEFFDKNSNVMPVTSFSPVNVGGLDSARWGYDARGDYLYALGSFLGTPATFKLQRSTGGVLSQKALANNLSVGAWNGDLISPIGFFQGPQQGQAYFIGQSGLNNCRPIVIMDAESGQQLATIGGLGIAPDVLADKWGPLTGWTFFGNFASSRPRVYALASCTLLEASTTLFKVYDNGATLKAIWKNVGGAYLGAVIVSSFADDDGYTLAFIGRGTAIDKATITGADALSITQNFATLSYPVIAGFEASDQNPVFFCSGAANEIVKVDLNTGAVLWRITSAPMPFGNLGPWMNSSMTGGKLLGYLTAASGGSVVLLDMAAGTIQTTADTSGNAWGVDHPVYDAVSNSFLRPGGSSFSSTLAALPVPGAISLSSFLVQLCQIGGYSAGQIAVSGISDSIDGAMIYPPFNLRDTLSNLGAVFNFEVYESDGQIRITKRSYAISAAPDFTVPIGDRAVLQEGGSDAYPSLSSTRPSEDKLPAKITLKYIDPDYDYNLNSFTWQRPAGVSGSSTEQSYAVPIVMTAAKAAALVQTMLYQQWGSRMSHAFRLGPKYLTIDPGDIVKLTGGSFVDYVKVTNVTINGDWSVSVGGETIQTDTITPPVYADDPYLTGDFSLTPNDGTAQVLVIDTPPILPSDLTDDFEVYVALIAQNRGSLTAAVLQKSLDGQPFSVMSQMSGATAGIMLYALGNGQANTIDRLASLNFPLINGAFANFASASEDAALKGANRIIIGRTGRWEIIGFTGVSVNTATKIVTLTGLIRGLEGTDVMMGTHQAGDYAVLYEVGKVSKDTVKSSYLNKAIQYRAAGADASMANALVAAWTVNGNSDKPWAPYFIGMTRDGSNNLTLTWLRRSRGAFTFTDGTGTAPLEDTPERYDVEILNGSGTVVRTFSALTTPTVAYSAANQSSDGFTPPLASLCVRIYQVGPVVGRGFARDVIANV